MQDDISRALDVPVKFKQANLIKQFKSKKHTVTLISIKNSLQVVKLYYIDSKMQMDREYQILTELQNKNLTPQLYEKDNENLLLLMQYIPGVNVCEYINDPTISYLDKKSAIKKLADWFVSFHLKYVTKHHFQIRGDAHLRNFIYNEGIKGLDFEESRQGNPCEDIAELCVSIITTDPIFTNEKINLCNLFYETYKKNISWNLDSCNPFIISALKQVISRRSKDENLQHIYQEVIKNQKLNF